MDVVDVIEGIEVDDFQESSELPRMDMLIWSTLTSQGSMLLRREEMIWRVL